MSGLIDLRGHHIWSYRYDNSGDAVVILHGGLSHSGKILPYLLPVYAHSMKVFAYDRSGHGRSAYRDGAFDMNFQRDELVTFLEEVVQEPAHLIGHSDGANCAVMAALARHDLVKSVVAIGPSLHPRDAVIDFPTNPQPSDEDQVEHDALSPDTPDMFVRKLRECFEMWAREPQIEITDLAALQMPVLFLQGDDDVITNATAERYAKAVKDGRLSIIPGASHDVIKEKTALVQATLLDFYANLEYPETKYPNWRN